MTSFIWNCRFILVSWKHAGFTGHSFCLFLSHPGVFMRHILVYFPGWLLVSAFQVLGLYICATMSGFIGFSMMFQPRNDMILLQLD